MWNKLYNVALKVQNGRTISQFIEASGVAERNAIANINLHKTKVKSTHIKLNRNEIVIAITKNKLCTQLKKKHTASFKKHFLFDFSLQKDCFHKKTNKKVDT